MVHMLNHSLGIQFLVIIIYVCLDMIPNCEVEDVERVQWRLLFDASSQLF